MPTLRYSSRIILLDEQGRVLLFRTNMYPRPLWITPGGGLEPGESHEDAARRELWEETGVVAELSPCVWVRRRVLDGIDHRQRFYVARLPAGARVTTENFVGDDHMMVEHRWWSIDEISASGEWFSPQRLAELVPPLVAGDFPSDPIDCGI
jgi:8-oxo-dGTP pyrophosphatase MutT (NUDIX family)